MNFSYNFEGVLLAMRGCTCVLRGCSRILKTPNSPSLFSSYRSAIFWALGAFYAHCALHGRLHDDNCLGYSVNHCQYQTNSNLTRCKTAVGTVAGRSKWMH